ncbi:uncharacterized protein LOC122010532 [Zingiber officinale]|uniref:uncharacterized protein LOC122010532 n=1 Tax=Zingiber officinale TaxID=94328 RepID=UPI001C4DC747|nr:uncharacterized protein LOC122010532 [Zingiber officinale]
MESKQERHDQWRPRRCLAFTVAAIIGVAILLLVLGLTVFRPRHAVTSINSVHLSRLTVGLDVPNLAVDFNVTLTLDIASTNPNHASFRYDAGDAVLYYRGQTVGEAAVPPGKVAAEGSVRTNVSLSVMAGKLIGDSALYADVILGSVPFSTTTRIPGTVAILGIFKHHMVAYTMCDLVVGVRNRSVENSNCRYRTKF